MVFVTWCLVFVPCGKRFLSRDVICVSRGVCVFCHVVWLGCYEVVSSQCIKFYRNVS